jgi:hypothetical protein
MAAIGPLRLKLVSARVVGNQIQKHALPIKYFSDIAISGFGLTETKTAVRDDRFVQKLLD